jgi:hypothetical protein
MDGVKMYNDTNLNSIPVWDNELRTSFAAYKGPYIAGRVAAQHNCLPLEKSRDWTEKA